MKEQVYSDIRFVFLNDEFSDYEMKEFPSGTTLVVTDYEVSSYDGSGNLIAIKDGKYFLHNCGHCSCNGPTDGMNFTVGYEKLSDIEASKDYEKEIQPIIDWLKVNHA